MIIDLGIDSVETVPLFSPISMKAVPSHHSFRLLRAAPVRNFFAFADVCYIAEKDTDNTYLSP